MALLGRERECKALDRLLDGARAGHGGCLVLRGEPGIGKTALVEHAVAEASDLRVAQVAGVEAEAELGHAALHRLLRPFLGGLHRLPGPQRDGLGAAFGLVSGPPANRFLVGLATLTLLSAAADERPLLVVCDDAQWLDRDSVEVLAFVGRRLDADAVALLFAVRERSDGAALLPGLPTLTVPELSRWAAGTLLTTALDGAVDRVVLDRVLVETRGNPLAIHEVARTVLAEDPVSERTVEDMVQGEPLPLDQRLQVRFAAQARQLDPLTRTVLLVAAADGTGDPDLVRRAVLVLEPVSLDGVAAAVEDALRSTLLVAGRGAGVRFRHPLIRSAVYGDARPERRRRVHAALAAATDPMDADRRAWHRGAAVLAPDEAAAAELEHAAERARSRGGFLTQAAFLSRAADLTAAGARRNGRLIAAATTALTAGAPYSAEALLASLTPGLGPPDQDAAVAKLRANLANLFGRSGVVALLLDAVRTLHDRDDPVARDTLLEALAAVTITRQLENGLTARDVARAALAGGPLDRATPAELLRVGHGTLVALGHDRAAPILRRALAAGAASGPGNRGAACLLDIVAALELWDAEALVALSGRYSALATEQGALRLLQIGTYGVALGEVVCGLLATASETFAGYREVLVAISADRALFRANDVLLHAWRGDRARTEAAAEVQAGPPVDRPAPAVAQLARWALMVLALGQGRSADAQQVGQLVLDEDPPHLLGLVLPDLVEAAVRNDARAVADRALAQLAVRADVSGTAWAQGVLARSRALLARATDAEAMYLEAVRQLGKTPVVTDLARAHLLYGEWLRRQRRRTDAREQLRLAHGLFDEMGAAAFAERARLELLATGERARSRALPAGRELTPQEARIARLAAGSATNTEIASALFLSPNTVEYHLRKVFRKLDVTSRRQLAPRLAP